MATTVEESPGPLRSFGVEMVLALALTGIVYGVFWERSLPAAPSIPVALGSLVAGTVVGGVGVYLDERSDRAAALEDDIRFGIVMAGLLGVGLFLYPNGFPLPIELGLLVAIWTSVLAQALAMVVGH